MSVLHFPRVSSVSKLRLAALSAFLLGSALVFIAGFAPVEVLHNTAHDSRHSAGFPCH